MDLKVKSIDGVAVETAPITTDKPVKETPKNVTNKTGDIVINLDELSNKEDKVVEPEPTPEPITLKVKDSTETTETPEKEEVVRESSLGEVHVPEKKTEKEDETSKPTLERVEESDESPTPIPEQKEVPPQAEAQKQLPENVDKLVSFLDDTGGTIEDYVNLNKDISALDDIDVIKEYYRQKNPRLSEERLTRKMDKSFLVDKDLDEPDVIQDKKDAFEDELYEAQKFLNGRKDKYYADLKTSKQNNLPTEAKEAMQFYNDQKQSADDQKQLNSVFLERTEKLFNEDFKGFDFKVGESKFRVNVGDASKVKQNQSDLTNFISKFVGEDGTITNPAGYHKALYAANNADSLAQHFYEQGRADAITESAKSSKNIDMGGRSDMSSSPSTQQGPKVRVVSEPSDGRLRIKL